MRRLHNGGQKGPRRQRREHPRGPGRAGVGARAANSGDSAFWMPQPGPGRNRRSEHDDDLQALALAL
eukprot:COSAG06_NODE_37328_length_436_cov_1.356083_1_plen_66_part_10